MKKLIFTLLMVFSAIVIIAQAPHAFKYQAAVRNSSGEIMSGQLVSLKFTVLDGYPGGSTVYSEVHQPITNQFGLVSLELGQGGAPIVGNFELINWSSGNHFLQVELDENGSSNYQLMGVSPLLSVPYSKWADSAGNVVYSDTSAFNELQHLALIDHELFITDGNSVILPDEVEDADPDPGNELQILDISFDTLIISDGNFVVLPLGESFWMENAGNIFFNSGKVGIGTEEPFESLHVKGNINSDSTYMLNGSRVLAVKSNNNTFVGRHAGLLNSTADNNTVLGSFALNNVTSGGYNTAIGALALMDNQTGSHNTAVGTLALQDNAGGSDNTAIGAAALRANIDGNSNVAIGDDVLLSNISGYSNTAVGSEVLYYNTTGYSNCALGHRTLFNNNTGNLNIAIGSQALGLNTSGSERFNNTNTK